MSEREQLSCKVDGFDQWKWRYIGLAVFRRILCAPSQPYHALPRPISRLPPSLPPSLPSYETFVVSNVSLIRPSPLASFVKAHGYVFRMKKGVSVRPTIESHEGHPIFSSITTWIFVGWSFKVLKRRTVRTLCLAPRDALLCNEGRAILCWICRDISASASAAATQNVSQSVRLYLLASRRLPDEDAARRPASRSLGRMPLLSTYFLKAALKAWAATEAQICWGSGKNSGTVGQKVPCTPQVLFRLQEVADWFAVADKMNFRVLYKWIMNYKYSSATLAHVVMMFPIVSTSTKRASFSVWLRGSDIHHKFWVGVHDLPGCHRSHPI